MILDTKNDDKLPRIPVLTPERQAEADAEQQRLAKTLNLSASPSQRELARALAIIESYSVYDADNPLPASAIPVYAEALVTAGRYEDAYDLTGDKLYREIANAFDPNAPKCECPDTSYVEMVDGRPVLHTHSRFFVRRKIYSRETASWHDLKACNKCGRLGIWHDEN